MATQADIEQRLADLEKRFQPIEAEFNEKVRGENERHNNAILRHIRELKDLQSEGYKTTEDVRKYISDLHLNENETASCLRPIEGFSGSLDEIIKQKEAMLRK